MAPYKIKLVLRRSDNHTFGLPDFCNSYAVMQPNGPVGTIFAFLPLKPFEEFICK